MQELTEYCVICLDEKSISELNLYSGACSSCNHRYNKLRKTTKTLDEVLKDLQREGKNEANRTES